ncbi:protein jagunal [Parasteatoda tepidariorum]|uniref:Protein jagunal n=1 Tax=Parasteatoda tepidariorum TaxID=114398 RepID=A0A2L2YDX3_PARTP|nr:protein jagunal [Parasteatoda tepidariorum]
MKQSNGFMQESMATEEVDVPLISNEKMEINNISSAGAEEFSLAPIKSKSVPLFKLTALYKSRLKSCIFLHIIFCFVLLAKLSEDILDSMDVFILQLEELYIPKPLFFEYIYAASSILSIFALRALAHNLGSLKAYAAAVVVFSICPLLIGLIYFFYDVLEYTDKKDEAEIEKYNGIPLCLIYYGYILIALQIHFFSLYFTAKLLKIWKTKMKKY